MSISRAKTDKPENGNPEIPLRRFSDISGPFAPQALFAVNDNVISYPDFLFASSPPVFPFGHAMTGRSWQGRRVEGSSQY